MSEPIYADDFGEWMLSVGWGFYGVRWRAPRPSRPRGAWEAWAGPLHQRATVSGYGTTARAAMDALLPKVRAALAGGPSDD